MKSAWLAEVMIAAPQLAARTPLLEGISRLAAGPSRIFVVADTDDKPLGVFGGREAVAMLSRHAALDGLVVADALAATAAPIPADLHPAEAWRLMRDAMVSGLVVDDEAGGVAGVLTEHGLMRHPACLERARSGSVASALRTERIDADATLDDALARLTGQKTDCLLVRENGAPAGLVGIEQLLAAFASKDGARQTRVGELMRPLGEGIGESASLAQALKSMEQQGACTVKDASGLAIGLVTPRAIAAVLCAQDSPQLAALKRRRTIQSSGGSGRAWLVALLAVLAVFATEQVIEYFSRERTLEHERNRVLERLSTYRARLEGAINANIYMARGLTAVIAAQPNLDQAGFAAIARGLVSDEQAMRIIAGAPGMVVSLIYPMAGNEAVVGLDYRTHPTQRARAEQARDSGRTVVAGPLPLVQGGEGVIVREPVFLAAAAGASAPRFWGLVSAVIDADRLYAQAGLDDPHNDLGLALRGTDGSGAKGPVFHGDPTLFERSPVTLDILLPSGSWQLAAAPLAGWGQHPADDGDLIRLMGMLAAAAAGVLAFVLVRRSQAVASNGARVEALLSTVPDMIWMKEPGGAFVACNSRFEQFFSVREADILGLRAEDFLTGRQAEAGICTSRGVAEWVSFDARGEETVFEAINTPVTDASGNLIGMLGVARDITERKRSERALHRQRDILDRTSRLARVGGWEFDVATMQGSWTEEAAHIHDLELSHPLTVEEALSFYRGESRQRIEAALAAAIERGEPCDLELEMISAKGIVRHVRTIGFPVRENGKVVRVEGAVQDVSSRRAAELRAKQGELLLDSVFEALPDLFFVLGQDGIIRDYRGRRGDLYVPPERFLGKRMVDCLPPEVAAKLEQALAALIDGAAPALVVYELPMHGGVRHFEARLSRIPGSTDCVAVVRDITERVAAEAELEAQRRESAFLADMLERTSQPVGVGLPGGGLGRCNQAFLDLLGYTREELAKLEWTRDLTPERWLPAELKMLEQLHATHRPVRYEKEYIRKDGSLVPIEIYADIVADAEGAPEAYFAFITDITERKRIDAALRESEARYRQLFENSPAPMLVYEKVSLRLLAVNAAFIDAYGYSRTEALTLLLPELFAAADRARIADAVAALQGFAYMGEWRHLRKDGSEIIIESRSHDIDFQGHASRVAVINDITERKRLEEQIRALNADLESRVLARTEELAAANKELETFTYSVSHDLKAPLRGIDGYSRLLLEDYRDRLDEEGRQFLDNVHRGVTQMNQLIEDLLAYSRMERRSLHGEPLALDQQVARVLDERHAEIEARGMRVETALDGLVARADRDGLAMVIRNLVDNAIKFTKHAEAPRLVFSGREEGDRIVLEVADNGIGFDMRFHDRIFEIFQRLQRAEDFPGTGVGLAIVRKAMLRMGGSIRAQSAPGEGATFYLELPR